MSDPAEDYHDPTAGIGGAPPARSALRLRLILAGFGFAVCLAGVIAGVVVSAPIVVIALIAVVAATAVVDAAVIGRRMFYGDG